MFKAAELKAGDSLTVGDSTKTLTDSISIASLTSHKFAVNDTLTTVDGKTYTVKTGGVVGTAVFTDDDGATVTSEDLAVAMNKEGTVFTNSVTKKSHSLVVTLDPSEVSSYDVIKANPADTVVTVQELAAAGTKVTLGEGAYIVTDGKKVTATDNDYVANSFGNVKNGILAAAAGSKVSIADINGDNAEE